MKTKFFNIAKKLCKHSNHPVFKMGACVVKKNKVLGLGFNQMKTHPQSKSWGAYIHAELSAIMNAGGINECNNCDIYIYRELKNGSLGKSFPCQFCIDMLKSSFRNVYYCDYDGYKVKKIY